MNSNDSYSIESQSSILDFFLLCGKLKTTKRAGWLPYNLNFSESIADHMYRMSICTFLIPSSINVNKDKCIKMAIVHDLGESIIGDITPDSNITKQEKYELEKDAMLSIKQMIEGPVGQEIVDLWLEYSECITEEAKFVKDIDKFEFILQAYEYEKEYGLQFDKFYNHPSINYKNDYFRVLDKMVRQRRSHLPHISSNLNNNNI